MFESFIKAFLYHPLVLDRDTELPFYARDAKEFYIDATGTEIHALYWPAPENRPTILFFHGNAQSLYEWALVREDFASLKSGLLLVEYPGYGKSSGVPNEESIYAAARAGLNWLRDIGGVPDNQILVFGKSLGGAVAVEIAQDLGCLGIILESTFRSMPAVVRRILPLFPAGLALRSEKYDSMSKLARLTAPVLVIHGSADALVPVNDGRVIYGALKVPRSLYVVQGAGHNDVSHIAGEAYGRTIKTWLDSLENR